MSAQADEMFDTFKQAIRRDIEEFLDTGTISRAKELSAQTGQHFNHNQYPMFFTGNLDSRIVLIHLNPKQEDTYQERYTGPKWLPTFDTYFDYHQQFGSIHYGSSSKYIYKSKFDHKQLLFLKAFGVIPFIEARTNEDKRVNLQRSIDEKLQLELIPYGSDKFPSKGWTEAILNPHITRVLDVISEVQRDYVIFCGQIFGQLLSSYITRTHTFRLPKKDGTVSKKKARFSSVEFRHNGQLIQAGIAHSFAQQGIGIFEYGKQCKYYYEYTK